jgi:amino acid transporter
MQTTASSFHEEVCGCGCAARTLSIGASIKLAAVEAPIQAHSAALRKELGLADLVLAQILLVVVPDFFGTAVKAGPSHVVLWLLAVVLFFIPLSLVVSNLNRLMPLEGGLYEWARLAFGDRIGFLVAWNLWLFATLYTAVIGLVTMTFLSYAIGPRSAWIASNRWLVVAATFACVGVLILVARAGLGIGKWVNNVGGAIGVLTIGVLILMPLTGVWRGTLHEYHPLRFVLPAMSFFSLSVFTKMTFGALCGIEYVAIFAGESRSPGRDLTRSIFFAAPIIVLLYVFGTSAILAYVSPDAVDVIGPIPQALSLGFSQSSIARFIVPVSVFLLLANYLATFNLNFSGNARLPMVAGWDRLLPEWFTKLDEKHRTPVNSILFVGVVGLLASFAVLIGVGVQEAYEFLLNISFTFYGLAYLVLFAIPLLVKKDSGFRPKLWLRFAAVAGLLVTLVFVLLSIFPIITVENQTSYIVKTAAVLLGANTVGLLLYRLGSRNHVRASSGNSTAG